MLSVWVASSFLCHIFYDYFKILLCVKSGLDREILVPAGLLCESDCYGREH